MRFIYNSGYSVPSHCISWWICCSKKSIKRVFRTLLNSKSLLFLDSLITTNSRGLPVSLWRHTFYSALLLFAAQLPPFGANCQLAPSWKARAVNINSLTWPIITLDLNMKLNSTMASAGACRRNARLGKFHSNIYTYIHTRNLTCTQILWNDSRGL